MNTQLKHRRPDRGSARWLSCACVLLLMLCAAPALAQQELRVLLVMSGSGGPYAAFQQALHDSLTGRAPVVRIEATALNDDNTLGKEVLSKLDNEDLVIAVGTRATAAVLALPSHPPALSVLVPHVTFQALAKGPGAHHGTAAIFLDQPPVRYLALARMLLPEMHTAGVVYGPSSAQEQAVMERAAQRMKMTLHGETVSTDAVDAPLDALQAVLDDSQVLIALPDPTIYNRYTIQGILLTTFRHRVPVVGYSASMLHAGATAAIYSNPEQIAQQAAEDLGTILAQRGRYRSYPRYYHIRFNRVVARSLNLTAPDEASAPILMKDLEGSDARTPGNP